MFGNKKASTPTLNSANGNGNGHDNGAIPQNRIKNGLEKATLKTASAPVKKAEPAVNNVLGKGTVIEGSVKAVGDLKIYGKVMGDVDAPAALVIGESADIEGNITAQNAEISGRVKGTVETTGLLTIRASSKIDGDVITKNLNVEAGSTFNGRFQVGSVSTTQTEPKTVASSSNTTSNE